MVLLGLVRFIINKLIVIVVIVVMRYVNKVLVFIFLSFDKLGKVLIFVMIERRISGMVMNFSS